MILGDTCTRRCRFCAVGTGLPGAVDSLEPLRVAAAVLRMGAEARARHHGQPRRSSRRRRRRDGGNGAGHPRAGPRLHGGGAHVGLHGLPRSIAMVVESHPEIISHNVETVRRLTPLVRSRSCYERSLSFLRIARELDPDGITKSSIMLGLGETREEVCETLDDLRAAGCRHGQHRPVPAAHAQQHPRPALLDPRGVRSLREAAAGEGLPLLRVRARWSAPPTMPASSSTDSASTWQP